MARIKSVIWKMELHTEAKHEILKKYLNAWLPIMASWNGRVLYIDGFAGPGEYIGNKDGSPIIAIKAIKEHKIKIKSEIVMIFIEADKERYDFLKQKIDSIDIPSNIKIECVHGKFDKTLNEIFQFLDEQQKRIAPAFVFIDPFGFTGIPLSLVKRIMTNKRCEVLITFMYEEINRFISNIQLWDSLTETFGTDKWRTVVSEKNPDEREANLHNIYKEQLKNEAGIRYVCSFKMVNRMNKTDYFLFFGTNNLTGLKKMKEAMWQVDRTGNFAFYDATDPRQLYLFKPEPDYTRLKRTILEKFQGKSLTLHKLEIFILTKTPFRETHYKKQILAEMERKEEIFVECDIEGRKKYTYPSKLKNNIRINFYR